MNIEVQHDLDAAADELAVELRITPVPARAGEPARTVRTATVTIHLRPAVDLLRLDHEGLDVQRTPRQLTVDVGELAPGEHRTVSMTFRTPEVAPGGVLRLGTVEARYAETPNRLKHILTLPLAIALSQLPPPAPAL